MGIPMGIPIPTAALGLPWGLNFNPHTHPIPIPMGIPMGIPIPTAALVINNKRISNEKQSKFGALLISLGCQIWCTAFLLWPYRAYAWRSWGLGLGLGIGLGLEGPDLGLEGWSLCLGLRFWRWLTSMKINWVGLAFAERLRPTRRDWYDWNQSSVESRDENRSRRTASSKSRSTALNAVSPAAFVLHI